MFGKRRRAASSPAQRAPPPSASASLAASKAFIKSAESNGALSSAAAAAALRTHSPTPTSVADTVTKRMARRGSLSSNGSYSREPSGSLHRQSSSGSMTERSFRAPSPGRGSPAETNAPPVPPVPANIQHHDGGMRRRASSVEPFYRGASPGPRGGGRGVSLDRGASTSRRAPQRPANPLTHVSEEEDTARSINFSRPMSPGAVGTKPSPPQTTVSSGWFGAPVVNQDALQRMASTSRPKTSSGVSSHHVQNVQRSVQNAAERPVSSHRISHGVEGSRLSSGSMRVKPSGTAVQKQTYPSRQAPRPVDPNSPDAVYDPSSRTFIHKQDAMARHREIHEMPEPEPQPGPKPAETFHSVHIPEKQMDSGSPSPIRHYVRQEPPPPQRREEPLAAVQRHSDDFNDADVQPPEQANTSRRLEDSGYGTIVGYDDDAASSTVAQNQDNPYPRLSTPVNSRPASTYDSHDRERAGRNENSPLSPPRTAHFAPLATELTGLKHEPLPRSVSPAKSALKASPSVSRRGESPLRSNGLLHTRGASSEASDTASEEGGRRKKKNVRVSFEEDVVAPTTSVPAHPEPPSYGGLGASRWSPIAEKDDEFEDLKKPRPALPLFGSIRDKERRHREEVPEKVTETVSTSPVGDQSRVSSDIALGNIVSDDHTRKQRGSTDPLPPEVTSVEGSGYVSDSSDYSDKHGVTEHKETPQQSPAPEPKSLSIPHEEVPSTTITAAEQNAHVPDIAFQPATPSPFEKPEPNFPSITIPGGWDEDATGARSQTPKPAISTSAPSTNTAEPTGQAPQSNSHEEDTTDDESSIYSDAYEDLSEGGGFASIDALMDKPINPSSSGLMRSKYADQDATEGPTSKSEQQTSAEDSDDSQATPTQDWTPAQLHWSGLNASFKQADKVETSVEQIPPPKKVIDQPTQRSTSQDRPVSVASPSPATKPLKSALKKSPAPETTRPAEPQNKTTQALVPRESHSEVHMRRTMRGGSNTDAPTEPRMGSTMRSTMRGGPENPPRTQPQMRHSMRSEDTPSRANISLAASRHSMAPAETKPRGTLQKKNIPSPVASKARPQSMPAAKPKPAPVATYDSDSDASVSSFQRTRSRGSRQQGGRYTMRGSMRQNPTPSLRASAPAPRQVRAISPPESPSPAMRRSMRSSSPTPDPVKSSRFSIRSLSPMGRFRKGPDVRPTSPIQEKPMPSFTKQPKPVKQTPQPAKAPKVVKVPFKSRFADSSDEDEDDRPRLFQSRFEDSDDEPMDYELPPGLTPVRGIPRKPGEEDGDSTDLEEEVDEEIPEDVSKPVPQANGTKGNVNGQGAALATGSLRDSKHATLPTFESGKNKKKRGFFGLGKKKTPQAEPVPAQPEPVQPFSTHGDIPMPPAQRNRDKGAPMTPIDEDKEFAEPAPTSPKRSPKLQRRSTPDWPLPPPPPIGTDDRPMSSDGVASRRPRFATRQPSAVSNVSAPVVDAQGQSVAYGRSGKKKKFQGLRRVFGLND
ncbi:hypothetical protein COCC4DRAFT_76248 [Bipolaris maydis ATCC 48331]|uniref:Uncharacterized protein n=2 Tax=Cochliobolus heterostrophus TaxID=5016 RepID=M2TVL9_COCH5|nr:uncharacterized protein COCC4DRAFT_76248 [Bipolaris maydis ATCC 48331]EMD85776.1 hypothetical protein COCHEDRAFT_1228803 [Bipolaris maydis C5]KAJ5026248.1 hypothetical protein J3E73DRAFT_412829 [Bipolaris maydis]ENH99837.1 hypothetical protein COCC4DRAFT_76248 [Bipolaris maydis ATCC 48331]KAJ5056788.1 hypothetical protein J3E74DRAFT_279725 [Bipolaris maydis]KAJ6196375.1 hypothetical protein J3E72DRAFT_245985 [Bipolaris maydis]